MALTTRQRWMLYAVAGLLTGAAMLAVQPDDDAADAVVAPTARAARQAAPSPAVPADLALPPRPYGGAGRSPFGEPAASASAVASATAAAHAAASAAAQAAMPTPPPAPAAPPFAFLGRWTENGVTTVFLSHGGRQLAAVAGKPLTSDYLVEHIGARELRLLHVPTGQRHPLALVAGRPAAAATVPGPAPSAADTEEQN